MKKYDVIIVGAGPAGLAAAEQISMSGGSVLVIDSNAAPGGQLIKQIHKFFGSAQVCAGVRGIRLAERFYRSALENGSEFLFSASVYAIHPDDEGGYRVFAADGEKTRCFNVRAVVLAVGASENATAFLGWTKPGVITAGAAQTMANLFRVRFSKRVLMVGAGNVGLIVSYQLMQAGIDVTAVIEAAPKIGGYAVHADKIRRVGVPIYTSHTILEALGEEQVEGAIIAELDDHFNPVPGTEQRLDVDTICLAVGLSPLVKLAAVAGCKLVKNPAKNETIPWYDDNMMTSKKGIFVAGDLAGVEEASIALEEGGVAGVAVANYLGFSANHGTAGLQVRRRRLEELRRRGKDKLPVFDVAEYTGYTKPKALIECFEGIPCNPCERSCPLGAITVGDDITNLPVLNLEKCSGCGKCVVTCPGMACFLLNMNHSDSEAEIAMPYEFWPIPGQGENVRALSRSGEFVCVARVTRVRKLPGCDHTMLLYIAVPKKYAAHVRSIDRKELAFNEDL